MDCILGEPDPVCTIGEDPAISLSCDDAGNLSQDGSADGDHKYVYDYRNRLIGVQEYQTDTWNDTAEYKYDAVNRRVLKVVTNKGDLNGTTRFIWGGSSDWQCLEERDGSDDLVARYTYAPGYIDAVAVQERDLNSDDDFGDDDEVVYYHSTTLYSIYALTDADENVIERYRYDAYGATTVLDADFSDDADNASDVDNPYTFTARRLDAETGIMQYRYRYYSVSLGRFVSRDPAGYFAGLNLYAYVGDMPVRMADPLGRWGWDVHYEMTARLARELGLFYPALIGEWCNGVDTTYPASFWRVCQAYDLLREAEALEHKARGLIYAGRPVSHETSMRWRAIWLARARRLRRKAEEIERTIIDWHFPGGDTGIVEGGSDAAWAKVNEAIENCDWVAFSMGLHPLQDSWAHSNIMPDGTVKPLPFGFVFKNSYGHTYRHPRLFCDPRRCVVWSFSDADRAHLRQPVVNDVMEATRQAMEKFLKACGDCL